MAMSRRLARSVSALLGLATAAATTLTTCTGLAPLGDHPVELAVSVLAGLVSGVTTAVSTASALNGLGDSRAAGGNQEGSGRGSGLPDVSGDGPEHDPEGSSSEGS